MVEPLFFSHHGSSVCDPRTSSNSITWEFVRNADFSSFTSDALNQKLGMGPRDLCFNRPFRWFWSRLKCENFCFNPSFQQPLVSMVSPKHSWVKTTVFKNVSLLPSRVFQQASVCPLCGATMHYASSHCHLGDPIRSQRDYEGAEQEGADETIVKGSRTWLIQGKALLQWGCVLSCADTNEYI